MRFDLHVAEPPVTFFSIQKSLDLIMGMRVINPPGHPAAKHGQDFVRIVQIGHHAQIRGYVDVERRIEFIHAAMQGFDSSLTFTG